MAYTNILMCFPNISFWQFQSFRSHIKVFGPFWVDLCIGWELGIKFQYFACGNLVFPAPLIEEVALSPKLIFGTFVEDHLADGFIWGLFILFHWCMCLFLCQYHFICYHGSAVHSEIRYCNASRFVLFVWDCFGCSGS
jgi:hypothetical protein